MKTTKLIILTMALSLMGFGCAKSSSQANPVATVPMVPAVIIDPLAPGGGSGGGSGGTNGFNYSTGATATFVPVSADALGDFAVRAPLNGPSNIKINVNLQQTDAGRYGGSVSISFMDNGIHREGYMRAGMGRNSVTGGYDDGVLMSNYNYWFHFENKLVFSGYFEDEFGAITIVLEPEFTTPSSGTNDAEPISASYKGAIYYKNFMVARNPYVDGNTTATMAPHGPVRSCWHIYKGPYDCRSNVVHTKCGLNPGVDAGYKKLGTFTGLNTKAAFNMSN